MKTLESVTREQRDKHGQQVSLLHFAPWNAKVSKGPVTLDLSRDGVRTMFEASLRLWLAGSSPTITDEGHPDGTRELPSFGHVKGLVTVPPEEASEDLPAGFYAVARWNDHGWAAVQSGRVPAVSMGLRINGTDHSGQRWPYRMTHLAVVSEPLFDYGQRRPVELLANAGSTGEEGITLDATNHTYPAEPGSLEAGMEEALAKIMELLEQLSARIDAMEKAPEEAPAELPAEKHEEEKADASAGVSADLLARLAAMETRLAGSERKAQAAQAEATAAKAALQKRDVETVVDAALKTRQIDGGRRADLVALALRDRGAFDLLAAAAPVRENFSETVLTGAGSVEPGPAADRSDMQLAAMRAANSWQEDQIQKGVLVTPSQLAAKTNELFAALSGGR
jgi:hypothetical protein